MAFLRELFQQHTSTLVSLLLLAGLPLVGDSLLTWGLHENADWLRNPTLGQMVLYFVVVAFTMTFALTHTTVVVLVTGFYLGWKGFPGMLLTYMLAALLGYLLAVSLDRGKVIGLLERFPKAHAVMQELRGDSWRLVLLTRLSPVLPFALITFILAVVGVPRRQFLTASVVGMLPRTVFFYWLGTKAQDVLALIQNPDTGTAGKVLVAVLLAVSLFGLYFLFSQALKRALRPDATSAQKNFS
ncbi:TVP38/TMEM64 family protein [Hymenobacter weizhouensis]|uniref:TVP38/TMEM64 family protein n=1 Tax=Hymenobacter sp. YIM 151500-1 TaxID=2987689 RepID=UPI0022272B3B|nr:VTT domain-containing protein [Hymenobacter sp. YIM 151500-1]UYZ63128.1 VTT domain-containing protein [Hymenobacter sp. YIM 151500-1]